jgi:regulator of replication initiation timing
MNKGLLKNILIVLLLSIVIFCIFKYIRLLKEKEDLLIVLNQTEAWVSTLEDQKQNLLQTLEKDKELQQKLNEKNSGLKKNLKASLRRLTKLFRNIAETQNALEQLNSKYSLLKAKNTALIEAEKKLREVSQENENLKERLSSIAGPKKADGELKKDASKVTSIAIRQRVLPAARIVEGNQGFLIKDGKPAYPTKVKIEVIPVTSKPQETKE